MKKHPIKVSIEEKAGFYDSDSPRKISEAKGTYDVYQDFSAAPRGTPASKGSYDVYQNFSATPVLSSPFSGIDESKLPPPIASFHELSDKLGLGADKELSPKGLFIHTQPVPSIYYEEMSKAMGFAKGYSTINLSYEANSNQDLFKHYEDYIRGQAEAKMPAMPFPEWADYHFRGKPPEGWRGDEANWEKIKKIYEAANLRVLSDQDRSRYEAKIIDGKLYVKSGENGHPNHIYNPENKAIEGGWVLANSSFGKKNNNRGSDLIFVLVEDHKTHEKKLYVAADIPGIFHHTTFSGQGVVAAGTVRIGQSSTQDPDGLRDGDILSVTADSGHYRPSRSNFVKFLEHLQDHKAMPDDITGKYFMKNIVNTSSKSQVVTNTYNFANRSEAERVIEQEKTSELKVFLTKNAENLGDIWKRRGKAQSSLERSSSELSSGQAREDKGPSDEQTAKSSSPVLTKASSQTFFVPKASETSRAKKEEKEQVAELSFS
jgi:hypothetical protein